MSLKAIVAAGVLTAVNQVREFFVNVEWTFVSSSAGDYDPVSDTYAKSEDTRTISVLPYEDKDDDTQMMFSSRGNFVETPTQMDTMKVLLVGAELGGNKPTVKDHFFWDEVKYVIDGQERVPGDSVFIMKASRA